MIRSSFWGGGVGGCKCQEIGFLKWSTVGCRATERRGEVHNREEGEMV